MPLPNPETTPPPRLSGLAILAAEDNPTNRLVLQEMLEIEGAAATCVADGRQLVDRVRNGGSEIWSLILTDLQMPDVDGFEAARQLRLIAPALPVVGLTAYAGNEDRAECIAAGMVDHLGKPYNMDQLVAVVLRNARR